MPDAVASLRPAAVVACRLQLFAAVIAYRTTVVVRKGASGGKSGEALVPAWHAEVAHPERTTAYAAPPLTAVASMHHNEAASCGML